ncbi:hypothetical protein Tco_1145753 [Tanacetum coccineum]
MYEDMSYSMLDEMMKKKFNLEANDRLYLSVKLPSFDSLLHITDDDEVNFFVECACSSSDDISHLHPAIALSVRNEFPLAFHGVCCRHLMMNKSLKKKKTKGLYWKICKANTPEEFTSNMNILQAVQPDAYNKLIEAGPHRWSRAHCPVLCYNYMTSNSVDSVNAIVLKRKLPITMLTETYHAMVQDWYCKRREFAANMKYEITNWVADKVHKRKLKSAAWIVNDINQYQYQVLDGRYNREVNIITGSCECRKWQLSGITYGHVIAITRFLGLTDYVQFIEDWFKKTNIKALMRNQFILLEICKNGNF